MMFGLATDLDFFSSIPIKESDLCSLYSPNPEPEPAEDDDEEIDLAELEKCMWRDKIARKRLKETNKGKLQTPNSAKERHSCQEQARRKKMSRSQDGILKYMLKMMEVCQAQGFVYGIIPEKGKPVSGASDNLCEWWKEKVRFDRNGPAAIIKYQSEKVDAAAAEALEPFVRKIRDEKYGWKYGCGAKGCTKLFHASEFVQKHLKLKHPELMTDLTTEVCEEFDENAPGGTPVMQTSLKDNQQRCRPGFDNRIKDDRGNRRERDNRANGNEHFDRSENLQSDDFSNNDGNNVDEQMFDSFGGQGISVAAFSSDIPPPLLMPVPGGGPLGPFVPAPPEVAMQMMRDQGGPSLFEGGRNGRSGPQIGGPSPIIAMPPNLRQDPRRLRSYNDIDAPDDEVTVIDYRSL